MHGKLPEVKLRKLNLEDAEDRYRWCLDKEVTRYLNAPDTYPPFTMEETKSWIQKCIDKSNGYEQKAILTGEGQHIGWVDLKNIDTFNQQAELGITIGERTFWGKGYGMAALMAMLHWGFQELNLHKIWLRVDIDNQRAITSYKRTGFVEEGILREDRKRGDGFVDRLRMSILGSEFLKL
ncbi:GNAT family N-acetyltransferase [Oceanobacillus sp. J11TS1]|uniref:GNAT family N-acetyltransferase n=1 Tax=Oceanobacillus sp. J11TS1 TaxID=2807191 RepID=UPI001B0708E7|nr:GNAT family protein [Oceanobacillus sp. J11TS1]GIO21483.1 N-acetyltransferase [Oceanobacillus sp. J11TS1]